MNKNIIPGTAYREACKFEGDPLLPLYPAGCKHEQRYELHRVKRVGPLVKF